MFTCSLTGGIGATGLNTSMALPAASVIGAVPAASPFPQPTIPAATVLPVITQSVGMSTPTEFLLLKNMFDPAVEVFLICEIFILYMINFLWMICLLLFHASIITLFLKIYIYVIIYIVLHDHELTYLQPD